MGKQQCLLQSLWIHICENLCFWFWFWRGKRKQESVTLATQEAFSCVLDSSTLPWHSICFKLLGLPFSNFTAAPNLQHPRFSCCLFQSDKCISRLNICIPIISEFLGLEVRITGEDNTWYKIIVIQRWNFRQWGFPPTPRAEGSPFYCQIIHLILLTYKIGQGHSLLALKQSPLSGGGSRNR